MKMALRFLKKIYLLQSHTKIFTNEICLKFISKESEVRGNE